MVIPIDINAVNEEREFERRISKDDVQSKFNLKIENSITSESELKSNMANGIEMKEINSDLEQEKEKDN